MRRLAGLVVAVALCAGSAWAQNATPNPVVAHYRAYNAALARGDMDAAETSAAAAVEASQARDGDGGSTPILVMNLAQVRVSNGRYAEALEPAQRAVAFAQGGVQGLDLLSARLVLAQAELSQNGRGAVPRLQAVLLEARNAGGRESEVYLAAARLGTFAISQRRYQDAVDAYTMAIDLTTRGDPAGVVVRANALIGRGAAHMLADEVTFSSGSTGTNISHSPEGLAELDYAEALRILRPLAVQAPNGAALTQPQQLYASALAWSVALRAKLRSLGWEDPAPLQGGGGLMIGLSPMPPCAATLDAPDPIYPGTAASRFGVGSVVVRVVTNESGEIVERSVVSAIGEPFQTSVERVLPRWRYEWQDAAVQSCSRASVRFIPYLFFIGDEHG